MNKLIKNLTEEQLNQLALWIWNAENQSELIAEITDELVDRINVLNEKQLKAEEKLNTGTFPCLKCGEYSCNATENKCKKCEKEDDLPF